MVDTSRYYKDWDDEISLGNQLEFHLENQSKDQIVLGFRVYNLGLAIEWLKIFYKIIKLADIIVCCMPYNLRCILIQEL